MCFNVFLSSALEIYVQFFSLFCVVPIRLFVMIYCGPFFRKTYGEGDRSGAEGFSIF